MKILVVGGGGREHAICLSLSKSKRITKLFCAPGNAGISSVAECIPIPAVEVCDIVSFAISNSIDYVVVAPEDPLALGLVDALENAGIRAFGPKADAAVIESSKVFSKNLMEKYGIPTAKYAVFTDINDAKAYIKAQGTPIVVKADGLAMGKGVVIAEDIETAYAALDSMMVDKKFGDSGGRVVIEEFLTGPEVTVLAFTDGKTVKPMLSSQDHKRALTGDRGLNTGGMGAFCPSPNYTDEIAKLCMDTIFKPTVDAMQNEGRPFKGVIYFGLILTSKGPRVIEYNARFGDPETQPLLTMLETDLLDIFESVTDEKLDEIDIKWHKGYSCCVVMASGGYPESYKTGLPIRGLNNVPDDIIVFHAGTALNDADCLTNGGRVLGVTAVGETLEKASLRAYDGVSFINFENAHYRTDIGRKIFSI